MDSSTSESEEDEGEENKQMDNSRSSMVESTDGSRLSIKQPSALTNTSANQAPKTLYRT